VRKSLFWKGITFGIVGVIIFFTLTYASEKDTIKFQGYVMDLNFGKRMMDVNEMLFVWDEKTIINNHAGLPTTMDKLKPHSWVYIEAERDNVKKQMVIRKIYLLPKYIDKKERNRYPFMQ
jgi:hypothetical protein